MLRKTGTRRITITMIKKEYTKEGIKLTHPSGYVVIETVDALRRRKENIQAQIKKSKEMLQHKEQEILDLINAGAV